MYEYRCEIPFLWCRFWQWNSPLGRFWTPKCRHKFSCLCFLKNGVLPWGLCLVGGQVSCCGQNVSGMVVLCWVMPKWKLSLCSMLPSLNQLLQLTQDPQWVHKGMSVFRALGPCLQTVKNINKYIEWMSDWMLTTSIQFCMDHFIIHGF